MRSEEIIRISGGVESLSTEEALYCLLRNKRVAKRIATYFDQVGAKYAEGEDFGMPTWKTDLVFEVCKRFMSYYNSCTEVHSITVPQDAVDICQRLLVGKTQEHFCEILLDVKNRPMGKPVDISIGTLDTALVHPRDVFSLPIKRQCAGIIILHNHPSGDPTPSQQDIGLTKRLITCGEMIGIRVLDHIVVGAKTTHVSMRKEKLADFS